MTVLLVCSELTASQSNCHAIIENRYSSSPTKKARAKELDDYFALKFHPLQVMMVVGRSYKAEPECDPRHTLYDAWKDHMPCTRVFLIPVVLVHKVLFLFLPNG